MRIFNRGRLLKTRYVVFYFKNGRVRQETFEKAGVAEQAAAERSRAWVVQEKIFEDGFQRIGGKV